MERRDRKAVGPGTVVARSERVIAAPLGEEVVMMDVESGSYFLLDDIAGFVWAAIDRPRPLGELLAELQLAYDVTPARCEADVVALLERMRVQGLVQLT